jgi:hypothetical protein
MHTSRSDKATSPPPPPPLADRWTLWRWDAEDDPNRVEFRRFRLTTHGIMWAIFLISGPHTVLWALNWAYNFYFNLCFNQGLTARTWQHMGTGQYDSRMVIGAFGFTFCIGFALAIILDFVASPYSIYKSIRLELGLDKPEEPTRAHLQHRINRIRQEIVRLESRIADLDARGIPDPVGAEPGTHPRTDILSLYQELYQALKDLHGPDIGPVPPGDEWRWVRQHEEFRKSTTSRM